MRFVDEFKAAAHLDVTVGFLRRDRIRQQPLIPFAKLGRIVRYDLEQVDLAVTQRVVGGNAADKIPDSDLRERRILSPVRPGKKRGAPTKAERLAKAAAKEREATSQTA